MTGKIFISYRRGEDEGFTQALLARLERTFSPEQLFIDVDNIEPGLDFVRVLDTQVAKCDVVLAVIGRGWINARDEMGARRLDNKDDFVRVEIASALQQQKRVIPVLVGDAPMPRSYELPEPLKPLATRNAVRLSHWRFRADMEGLTKALQRALENAENVRKAQEEEGPEKQTGWQRLRPENAKSQKVDEKRFAPNREEQRHGTAPPHPQGANARHIRLQIEAELRKEEEERCRPQAPLSQRSLVTGTLLRRAIEIVRNIMGMPAR